MTAAAADPPIIRRPPSDRVVLEALGLDFHYGRTQALHRVDLPVERNRITALIGASGCGKSTLLRALNRIHDLYPGQQATGRILFDGRDVLADRAAMARLRARDGAVALDPAPIDVAALRARIGMVFQQPTPFPMSIYDNVAYGVRLQRRIARAELDPIVEQSLRRAALWDEVRDRLRASALGLSGGQQQRLCVARALAVGPEVLLLDEPASALDPMSTARLEATLMELRADVTIVIVTHNLQQAARVSDWTGFMYAGRMVEFRATAELFERPQSLRTRDFVTGRFG